jgi:hypothetical protein
MLIFKIQNNETKLFSRGKGSACFSKKGNSWNTLGALNAHLAWFRNSYTNCSIVTYEILEISRVPLGPQEPDKNQLVIPQLKEYFDD